MQLDRQAKLVSAAAYANSTLNTRRSQWRTYVQFCARYNLIPIPAEPKTIIRFLVHLSSYCKYSTIINYLSAINVLHRHFGYNVTFQDVFSIRLIIRGLRRILGDAQEQKLPITPKILLQIHPQLAAASDSGFWAAMLIGFYTFLRKCNLVPKSAKEFDPVKNLSRGDILIRPWGLVICVRWSKTIQFRERQLLIPVMRLSKGHPLCPVQAYERHISVFPPTPVSPAFLHSGSGHATPITHPAFQAKLRKVLSQADLPASKFSGHSFRRGGATFAFRCGAPVELISLQGDWSSDAVLLYIAQPLERRISVASMIARNMPTH